MAKRPIEIVIAGDMDGKGSDLHQALLQVPPGGRCVIWFDCPGGSVYTGVSLAGMIRAREIDATAVAIGECSSAAILPFACCRKRFVTPSVTMLFHPIKWGQEECLASGARDWARHFALIEEAHDELLMRLLRLDPKRYRKWTQPGMYVPGRDVVEAGIAKMIDLAMTPRGLRRLIFGSVS